MHFSLFSVVLIVPDGDRDPADISSLKKPRNLHGSRGLELLTKMPAYWPGIIGDCGLALICTSLRFL